MKWEKMWVFPYYDGLPPKEVEVIKIDYDYYLVKGETNTKHRSTFFGSKEDAYDNEIKDCDDWIKRSEQKKEKILKMRERDV